MMGCAVSMHVSAHCRPGSGRDEFSARLMSSATTRSRSGRLGRFKRDWRYASERGRVATHNRGVQLQSQPVRRQGHFMDRVKVKFHLFRVNGAEANTRSAEQVIQIIHADELGDRLRSGVRMDTLERVITQHGRERKWFLDFVRIRDTTGPGKAAADTPVEDLDIAADEFFSEETAALFLPDRGFMIVQYNHWGVRPSAIGDYLSGYMQDETDVYELAVRIDPGASQKYDSINQTTKFSIAVDVASLTAQDRIAGNALSDMVTSAERLGAMRLDVVLSIGHHKGRELGIKDTFDRYFGRNPDAVKRAVIKGREGDDLPVEKVDLIRQKLEYVGEIQPNPGRRLLFEDRRAALNRAYARWRQIIEA